MRWNTMFITAVCVIFLIKLRWLKSKSLSELHSFGYGETADWLKIHRLNFNGDIHFLNAKDALSLAPITVNDAILKWNRFDH